MSFLLDTNVISEWVRPQPDPNVVEWLADLDEDRVYLSAVSLAELRYGVERLPEGKRRQRLAAWLTNELPDRFAGRVLDVDVRVADACGIILARREQVGRPMGMADAFLAATTSIHGLTLATRNLSDFAEIGLKLLDPWRSG